MTKKISAAEYPISKIFSSDFEYIIPSYQRPYSWGILQAYDLFDDLYDFYKPGTNEGYFLGSIVLIKDENKASAESYRWAAKVNDPYDLVSSDSL